MPFDPQDVTIIVRPKKDDDKDPQSKLRGICVRKGGDFVVLNPQPPSPQQAEEYSGSPNKKSKAERFNSFRGALKDWKVDGLEFQRELRKEWDNR